MIKTAEVIFQSQEDAEAVLTAMKQLLDQYEQVTQADFLELSGLSSTFADDKVGWVGLTAVQVKSINSGYILDLPAPKEL
jgi:hypothetical protein